MSSPPSGLPEFAGRYQLGKVVGTGGFAVVVRAYDEGLAADVAIKILDTRRSLDPEIRERFIREARLLRRVRSPSLIGVHDVGETDDGLPYFVMDLATGTLEDRLKGPAPATEVARVVGTLAAGLGSLHAAGVIHRDVKPSNLLILGPNDGRAEGALLAPGEDLVLGDLGLAKDQQASSYGPTMVGGTPLYRAPEQMELGAPVDQRTDVYASSAVVWRLVTGADPPPPEQLEVQLLGAPEQWRSIFARGMAIRPQDRFESMKDWASAVSVLLGTGASPSTSVKAAATGATCPYKGLASFQADDAPLFFGRSRLVDELVSRLQAHPALVIGGSSGSGKSSLLRAGLLPALAGGGLPGSQNWQQVLMVPGARPGKTLTAKLKGLEGPVVVAVDQFEETFTVCDDPAERRRFLEKLAVLTEGESPRARVVIALRADFYGACAANPWLAAAINSNQLLVGPMTRSQLRDAVEGPARRVGLRLEEGLTDRILDDTGDDAGALPLLSHALVETWVRRRGGTLTIEGYEAAGGVAGAIGRSAEELWNRLDTGERKIARRVFLRLVRPGEAGRPDTKKGATREELGGDEAEEVVAQLATARLVIVGDRGVELAHEALLRAWGRLATWLDESRERLRAGERIEAAARDWEQQERSPDALYRGSQLAAALEWRHSLDDRPSEPAAGFLEAAEKAQAAEEETKAAQARRRAATRRRVLVALSGLAALAVLTSILAFAALGRSRRDARAAEEQLARNLAAASLQQAPADPYLATVLATEALARVDPPLPEAREALVAARIALEGSRPVPFGDPLRVGDALTIALDPMVNRAVTGQRNGELALWDLASRKEAGRTRGPKGGIQKVAVAPDGSWAIAGGDDGTLWRWSLSPAGKAEALRNLGSILWSLAVSPDGRSVAAATEAGEVWLADASSGAPIGEPVGRNAGGFTSVAFSPDGRTLLAGDGTGLVQAWSLPERKPRFAPIQAHTSDVWEIAVDPQNSKFLTVSSDAKSRLWDLSTGVRLPGGPQDEGGAAAAPDGLLGAGFAPGGEVVAGGEDGKLYSWSIDQRKVVDVTGTGHSARITDTARSAAGTRLVSLSVDQNLRVWDQSNRPGPVVRVADLGRQLYLIALSAGRAAVGTGDGGVVVIDAGSGKIERTLAGHAGRVFAMVAAGRDRLVTGDQKGVLRLWDLGTGRLIKTVDDAHGGPVNALAASPGGSIASAGADGVAKLWDGGLEPRATMKKAPGPLTGIAVSDSMVAGTTSSGVAVRWDLDGKLLDDPIRAAGGTLWGVDIDAEGARLALAGDDEVVSVWSGSPPARRLELAPHRGGALDAAFLGSTALAASSRTGEVRLWDLRDGRALGVLSIDEGSPVWHLAALADGTVWAADEKGAVVRIDAMVPARACELAARSFDDAQKNRLLGGEELKVCSSVGTPR